ncbi:unnamed protein product [Ectocarpus fasciculatus]
MEYSTLIDTYDCDCPMLSGRFPRLCDYIKEFSTGQSGDGLDIGAGPKGGYSQYFDGVDSLDGCDADEAVVDSLPSERYNRRYVYTLGGEEPLPHPDSSKDFVVCSCVIHHLNNTEELERALREMTRVLRQNGRMFLMFKAGVHNTNLTHFSRYYQAERTIRVFDPESLLQSAKLLGLDLDCTPGRMCNEVLVDQNWLVNCCLVLCKR